MTASSNDRTTATGLRLDECVSALQKSIRRALVEDACWFGAELDLSGQSWLLWNRLHIICSEDVGAAWPEGPAVLDSLHGSWARAKGRAEQPLYIADAIVRLCRARKTRIADSAAFLFWEHHEQFAREVPDYALDFHTQRGRRMGRGVAHFYDEGARIIPEVPDSDATRLEPLARKFARKSRSRPMQLPFDGAEGSPCDPPRRPAPHHLRRMGAVMVRVFRAETRPGRTFGVVLGRDPRGLPVYVIEDAWLVARWRHDLEQQNAELSIDFPAHRVSPLGDRRVG